MKLIIHSDGGSLNNPGPAGIGFLIHKGEECIHTHSEAIGVASNNVAEYTALIRALNFIKEQKGSLLKDITEVCVFADSELMVRQLNGIYKVKHPDLKPLFSQVKVLELEIGRAISYTHVLRGKNAEADALVKKALGR